MLTTRRCTPRTPERTTGCAERANPWRVDHDRRRSTGSPQTAEPTDAGSASSAEPVLERIRTSRPGAHGAAQTSATVPGTGGGRPMRHDREPSTESPLSPPPPPAARPPRPARLVAAGRLRRQPRRPGHAGATTEHGPALSTDGGRSFARCRTPRCCSWSAGPTTALTGIARPDGATYHSDDDGRSWQQRASIAGQPEAMTATGRRVFVALAGGTLAKSTDGGASYSTMYSEDCPRAHAGRPCRLPDVAHTAAR